MHFMYDCYSFVTDAIILLSQLTFIFKFETNYFQVKNLLLNDDII